jgi:D-cysteine desulfhydrase
VDALLARYPGLASIPHVDLGVRASPLERWRVGTASLLIKRDDLSADRLGGNKVRALELLLGRIRPGDRVLTVGATGSTHALAVAHYAAAVGATAEVITWPQEEHAVSRATAQVMAARARVTPARSVADAYLRAMARRGRGGVHWVPAGGSVPLGVLGHVSAALELAEQLAREAVDPRQTVVVPLGSGGTVAGLLVGFALAGLPAPILAVQVVPRLVASRTRVGWLAQRTHRLIARSAGVALPAVDYRRLLVQRDAYGGAYGRPTAEADEAAGALRAAGGPRLDGTYSAKAFGVALARARSSPEERVLFWLTFDGRWL